jgi:hypothetical protein
MIDKKRKIKEIRIENKIKNIFFAYSSTYRVRFFHFFVKGYANPSHYPAQTFPLIP